MPARGALARSVYVGVAFVVAIQASVVGWFAGHSWFFTDDFLFLRQAKDSKLSLSFLRLALFEHFSPVHRIMDKVLIRGFGPSWPIAAVVLVALTVACTLAFAYFVSSITVDSKIIVGTTGVYALSLFFIRTSIWWTAGVHLLAVTLFSLLTLGGYVRWHSRRSVASLVLSVCSLAMALLTHEDALLIIGFLVLLRLLVLTPHPRSLREVYRAFRSDLATWAMYGLLTALAAWNFAAWYWHQSPRPSTGEFTRYMWFATGQGFFSTLFLVKVPEAMIGSPNLTGSLALAGGLLVVGFTLFTRVGAWRPWLIFALAFIATVVPVGLSRVRQFGPTIGRDPVYQLGPAYLFLFAFAVAVGQPRRNARASGQTTRFTTRRNLRVAFVGIGVVALVGVSVHTAKQAVDNGFWQSRQSRDYFAHLRSDTSALSKRGIQPEIFNPQVPAGIVPAWLAPYDRLAINLMVPSISSRTSDAAYLVTTTGHLQHVRVDEKYGGPIPLEAATAAGWTSQGSQQCFRPHAGGEPVTVVLPQRVEGAHLVVRVDALMPSEVESTIIGDGREIPIILTYGAAYAYVAGTSISSVTLAIPEPYGCIERVSVGVLSPVVDP